MHTHIYRHSVECLTSKAVRGCICEYQRYKSIMLWAFSFGGIYYIAGWLLGSDLIRGDASHLISDFLTDIVALGVGALVLQYPSATEIYRRYGGFLQSILLCIAGILVLLHIFFAENQSIDGEYVILFGVAAILVNHKRLQILHPHEGLFETYKKIGNSLKSGEREITTYIAQLLHVSLDVLSSWLTVVGGIGIFLTENADLDHVFAYILALMIFVSALITFIFALRHK